MGVSISVGTATIFGIVFWLFDRYVWRCWPVRKWLGFCDINGKWDCAGQRLNPDGSVASEWSGEMTIVQTWSRISISLSTSQSVSRSGPASLTRDEGLGFCLLYTYTNDPDSNQPALHIHRGTCELRFADSCSEGSGIYFNDQHRLTFGRMKLTKRVPCKKTKESL